MYNVVLGMGRKSREYVTQIEQLTKQQEEGKKREVKQLEEEKKMKMKIQEQEGKINTLTNTTATLTTFSQNLKQLYPQLKKETKYTFTKELIKGISEKKIRECLPWMPKLTLKRVIATKRKIHEKKKRKFKAPQRIELARRIIGEIIPMVSGRNYRVQVISGQELYRRYCEEVKRVGKKEEGTHMALSITRINNMLMGWRIHHSTDATQCPICKLLHDYGNGQPPPPNLQGNELTKWQKKLNKCKNSNHKHKSQTQHKIHKQTKDKMVKEQLTDLMIILQDFTQLEPQSGFNQDFILTLLTYDTTEPDKIKRQYYHFIGEQDDKNDVYFVIAVWEQLLREKVIGDNIKKIDVWSDGGPKHFKIKECMYYFSTIKQTYNKQITYNFYESYHGHNSCDAAASHSKKRINKQQRDTNIPIHTAGQLASAINTLNHHYAQVTPQITKYGWKVTPIKGIKSFYKFQFRNTGEIDAYATSADTVSAKQFIVHCTIPEAL